jgi:hypothetical protein
VIVKSRGEPKKNDPLTGVQETGVWKSLAGSLSCLRIQKVFPAELLLLMQR